MALIKCSECGNEISDKATTCPKCGNPIKQTVYKKKPKKGHGCLIAILLFIIIVTVSIGGMLMMNSGIQKSISGVSSSDEYITLDEYNQVESGMSYEEVVAIIGSNGSETSTVTANDITISIYTWYGNGAAGSNANVTFTNNEVTAKAQVGLE